MSKAYKEYKDEPLEAAESGATYNVQTDGGRAPLLHGMKGADDARKLSLAAAKDKFALQQDMTVEELYDVIADEIDSIYAKG